MACPPDRRLTVLLPGLVFLLACCAFLPRCGKDEAPGAEVHLDQESGSLARLLLRGEGRGGRLALHLRGSGGSPLDISVPSSPGDSRHDIVGRLVEEMRKSEWTEGATWQSFFTGLAVTHVDQVLFRCTDVGLDIELTMTTFLPRHFGVCVRGGEPETTGGSLGLTATISPYRASRTTMGVTHHFSAGYLPGELLDRLEQMITDQGWGRKREDGALVLRELWDGSELKHMSVDLRRDRESGGVEHAADWTWGLTLYRP